MKCPKCKATLNPDEMKAVEKLHGKRQCLICGYDFAKKKTGKKEPVESEALRKLNDFAQQHGIH